MIRLEHPGMDPLVIDDHASGWICEELDIGAPVIRQVVDSRPRADGSVDETAHFGARSVSARLTLMPDVESTREMRDRLAAFCHPGIRPVMVFSQAGEPERRMVLRADQWSAPMTHPDLVEMQVQWVAPSGVIESTVQRLAITSPSTTAPGWSPPLDPPLAFPAHVGSGPVLVMNQGSAPASWQTAIFGPCTGPRLRNRTSGEDLSFPGLTIAAGDFLFIDQAERTVTLNRDAGASRYSWLDFAASTWFPFGPGGQLIEFDAQSSAPPASAWIAWRDTYL